MKRSDAASASTAATTAAHSGPNSSTDVKTSASDSENRVSIRGSLIMQVPVTIGQTGEDEPARARRQNHRAQDEAIRTPVPAMMTVATKTRAGAGGS